MLEGLLTDEDNVQYTLMELLSTTASLTESGVCLGTILIALVSVATLVSISIVRYQKKK